MSSLPEHIHKRLLEEFTLANTRIHECSDIDAKLYYFSVFYGETQRQLNIHWDPDLALLHFVGVTACQIIATRPRLPPGAGFPPDGIPEGFLESLDKVSAELTAAFARPEIDVARLYAALARVAELTNVVQGNGAFLLQKGMIQLG